MPPGNLARRSPMPARMTVAVPQSVGAATKRVRIASDPQDPPSADRPEQLGRPWLGRRRSSRPEGAEDGDLQAAEMGRRPCRRRPCARSIWRLRACACWKPRTGAERARALGALAYLTKPFDPCALAELVAHELVAARDGRPKPPLSRHDHSAGERRSDASRIAP